MNCGLDRLCKSLIFREGRITEAHSIDICFVTNISGDWNKEKPINTQESENKIEHTQIEKEGQILQACMARIKY